MNKLLFAGALAIAGLTSPASPITFSSLTTIYVVAGVQHTPTVSTLVSCSNDSGVAANLRFLLLNETGEVGNQTTVTLAHGATTNITAQEINSLSQKIVASGAIRGVVIIASTQPRVFCSAMLLDSEAVSPIGSALHLGRISGIVPARYERPEGNDHSAGKMIVQHMSLAEVTRRCDAHLPTHRAQALACALGDERLCLVFLPHKASIGPVAYERLYRHEHAHCNGWKH